MARGELCRDGVHPEQVFRASQENTKTNDLPHPILESAINLTCMFLGSNQRQPTHGVDHHSTVQTRENILHLKFYSKIYTYIRLHICRVCQKVYTHFKICYMYTCIHFGSLYISKELKVL